MIALTDEGLQQRLHPEPVYLPMVLFIDDSEEWQARWRGELRGVATVLSAFSAREALALVRETPDLKLIFLDGSLDGTGRLDTAVLLTRIRLTFSGTVIASSNCRAYRFILLEHGANLCIPKHIAAFFVSQYI